MKNLIQSHCKRNWTFVLSFLLFSIISVNVNGQCNADSGQVSGHAYIDYNNNGIQDPTEITLEGVQVTAYDAIGGVAAISFTDSQGNYILDNLNDGDDLRLQFDFDSKYFTAFAGPSNGTNVQFVSVPSCNNNIGVIDAASICGTNPQLVTTCFAQGVSAGSDVETIIGFEHNFGPTSQVTKYADHSETGSIWGISWKSNTSEIFSSAFVKQYAGLTAYGHGAIFRTSVTPSGSTTSLYVDLHDVVGVGNLVNTDINDCKYGNQVGLIGLGGMVISPDQEYLYVVNLGNKSVVRVSTTDQSDIKEYSVPDPGCSNGEYAPFAIKYYQDKLYVGVTCYASSAFSAAESKGIVYEFDIEGRGEMTQIFETDALKGYWRDIPTSSLETSHWLTDIDFTDDGHMLLGLTDRIGHRYCKVTNPRLDTQHPDLLMVYKDAQGQWTLESNGAAGGLTGTGVSNSQGPGGGEFFGDDYWQADANHHSEVALGSMIVLPGTNSVVAAVYDPGFNPYAGGFHKYSTQNGERQDYIELYARNSTTQFGKATGFGDVDIMCGKANIQIGNFVWHDENRNGVQDAGEAPISNIGIALLDDACNQIATTTTDQNGQYNFDNLEADKQYYISIDGGAFDFDHGILNYDNQSFTLTVGDGNNEDINSNGEILDINCGKALIGVRTTQTNHSFDLGLAKAAGFDLALRKQLMDNGLVKLGEVVPFRITVFNQGGIPAKNVKIVDYLTDGYEFNVLDNNGWSIVNGNAEFTFPGVIAPGQQQSTLINLKVVSNDLEQLVNVSEIASATDINDQFIQDDDSVMDTDASNDAGGKVNTGSDDEINDKGTLDEDDSDPAVPNVFDLALKQYYDGGNCVTGGDEITIKTVVYNQGNVPAKSFKVVNYGAPNLTFNPLSNPAWSDEDGKFEFVGGAIAPGGSVIIDLVFEVINTANPNDIINYAEIFESIPEGRNISFDFDSNPDDDDKNDEGGNPYNNEDNFVDGSLDTEEDDHDPIIVNGRIVDLALTLTTDARLVKQGDEVCFDVNVYNQGQMPVKSFKVATQIDPSLAMISNDWQDDGNNVYTKEVEYSSSFSPGGHNVVTYCVEVGDIAGRYAMVNNAEIVQIIGLCNNDLSDKDRDSRADNDFSNDLGGVPQTNTDDTVNESPTVDEDDHDPAMIINVESEARTSCEITDCPTEPGNGLVGVDLIVKAPIGMTWSVFEAIDINNASSSPSSLVDLTGSVLTETTLNATESEYIIKAKVVDGTKFTAVLVSDKLDYQTLSGVVCDIPQRPITGPVSLCTTGSGTYTIPAASGETFTVTVEGGVIDDQNVEGTEVDVTWTSDEGSITFMRDGAHCENPAILNVVTGSADIAMKCISNANLSIDEDCEVEITPDHIITGDPVDGVGYSVMISHNGVVIPGNIVDASHIGKTIEVKLIEGCGGNSCWGNILIEDKYAPTIACTPDVTVSCYKADQYTGPFAQDNCGDPVRLEVLDSVYTSIDCGGDINGRFVKEYVAIDAQGNRSEVCTQTIHVAVIDFEDIVFPVSYTKDSTLQCEGYELDANGMPSPNVTGVPTLEGEPLYPFFENFCNIIVTYTDDGPYRFGCHDKIERTWNVWDMSCNNDPRKETVKQTIVIGDDENPTFTCPDQQVASASFTNCEARVRLPLPTELDDDCSENYMIDIVYPGGSRQDVASPIDVFLPVGVNDITYRVYDDCGKSSECMTTVTVSDNTSPAAFCDQNTTVSLRSNGQAYMYAQTLDDGSTDACGIVSYKARRMDLTGPCGLNTPNFEDLVQFCCADVSDTPLVVELLVTDESGNSNTCMVNVFVQDKVAPQITCPDSVTISCEIHYDLNDLSEYGDATVVDVCGATLTESAIDDVDQCREGTITRTFTATDSTNTVSCRQIITIENLNPFDVNNITRPKDFDLVLTECVTFNAHPDSLPAENGRPIIDEGICDLVSSSYKDQYYNFVDADGTCFKIIRRWSVLNHCNIIDGKPQEITFDQVIKVINNIAPIITSDLSPIREPLLVNSCEEGFVALRAEAQKCAMGMDLNYRYEIYINGVLDPNRTRSGKDSVAVANGNYPLGDHYILWSFEDMCGNVVTERQDFSVFDDKSPTAGCLQSVAVALTPMDLDNIPGFETEMACIGPDSLQRSSSHPCQDLEDLTFSFSADGTVNEICFECFDLGINVIDLYVIDLEGDFDICQVEVVVQDNNDFDFCPTLEDCIIWPDSIVDIIDCVIDTTPMALGMPTVVDTCACDMFSINYVDDVQQYDSITCKFFERTWTVEFTCGTRPQIFMYTQHINRFNFIAPTINCPSDVTVDANANCEASVSNLLATIDGTACSTNVLTSFSSSVSSGSTLDASGVYPQGSTTITFEVQDNCNNTSCTTIVTVEDNTPPMAVCMTQPYEVFLDANGNKTINQNDINFLSVGSSDNCNFNPVISVVPSMFNCSNIGDNTAEVIVSDGVLSDTCEVTIRVVDNLPPTVTCVSSISRDLDTNGQYVLTELDQNLMILSGNDNCDVQLDPGTASYDCDDLGANPFVLTVTDGNLTSSCTVSVIIEDNQLPVVECNSISVNLDASGSAVLTPAQEASLVAGVTDNCEVDTSYAQVTFDCNDVNATTLPTVRVTVTDEGGNSGTCDASITVLDVTPPTIPTQGCEDITVMLPSTLMYMLMPADLNIITANVNDNCSFVPSSNATFTCDDLGAPVPTTIYVTDPSNNQDSCISNVTVTDANTPMLTCMDITVSLDASGSYSLNMMDSMMLVMASNGSCGTALTIDRTMFGCGDIPSVVLDIRLFDALGMQIDQCTPTVTVEDTIAPTVICNDISVSLTGSSVALSAADITAISTGSSDACDSQLELTVTPNTFDCDDLGPQTVTLFVEDDFGNVDSCDATVTIVDDAPIITGCQDITVTVAAGQDYVFTSQDSLDIVGTTSDNCPFDFTFTFDPINCVDTAMVTPLVVNFFNNDNMNIGTCSINVTAEANDTLICVTQNITVYLDSLGGVGIDPIDIDGGSSAGCNATITRSINIDTFVCNDVTLSPIDVTLTVMSGGETETCVAQVMILDTIGPFFTTCETMTVVACDTFNGIFESIFVANPDDNCSEFTTQIDTIQNSFNNCGLGIFERDIIITDPLSGLADTCNATIVITNTSDPITLADFSLPADVTVDNCSTTDTMATGQVAYIDDGSSCRSIEISFNDNPMTLPVSCQDTLVRTWTLTDTCNSTTLTYDQQIVVIDTVGPLLQISADTIFIPNPNSDCAVFADLSGVVTNLDCQEVSTIYSNNGAFANDTMSIDASGTYDAGLDYNITVIAEDCGRTDTVNYVVSVEAATYNFTCQKIIVAIDTLTDSVCVAATDVASVTGACVMNTQILIQRFDLNGTTGPLLDSIKYGCGDLGDNSIKVYLVVGGVIVDSCTTASSLGRVLVTVTDPFDACVTTRSSIQGQIATNSGAVLSGAKVDLMGSDYGTISTDAEGRYVFGEMPSGGDYEVIPNHDVELLEGVSTLDLVLIQRHILRMSMLENNYNIIAADVNNDDRVTVQDLVELRKAILGVSDRFTNNNSWKLVDASYVFPVDLDPFAEPYPTTYILENIKGRMIVDFVGVKIGDVNGSYDGNLLNESSNNRSKSTLIYDDQYVSVGQEVVLKLHAGQLKNALLGLQLFLEVEGVEEVKSVEIDGLEVEFVQLGNEIRIVGFGAEAIDEELTSIEIVFVSGVDGKLSDLIEINDDRLPSEIYSDNGEAVQINLRSNPILQGGYAISTSSPNPWNNSTSFSIEVPYDQEVILSILDINGMLITDRIIEATKGINQVQLSDEDVASQTGVMIIKVEAVDGTSFQRKMIRIE